MDYTELIRGCKNEDRLAQKKLYEHFYGRMMGVCLRYATCRDEAAVILNKGFLKVFRQIKSFDSSKGRLDSWIYKIILNTAIDHFRSSCRHNDRMADMDQADTVAESAEVLDYLSAEEIIVLIQKLTPAYRTVFNLSVMDGLSHAQIARELRISEGTVKSNLAKARKKLQAMVHEMHKVMLHYAK
ncbi:MAG: DNA-directed RNA polymerase sigma-70 factor [Chitinophagales bacterium]|nr:MAG: DNA-directed RNA polymerase sigma-70 factor [Chitinophagales bacterium]